MANNQLIYFAVPCFNQKDQVNKFLDSVSKQTYKNFKVVIVDDGSSDDTSELVKTMYPKTILLRGDGSLWWSGSTNLAVKRAIKDKANFVLTVNTDVELDPNYLKNILESAKEHPNSLIGSMVCYEDKPEKVWFFGGYYDQKTGQMLHREGSVRDFKVDLEADWLTGMGVLIPIEVFNKIGLYDKVRYPQYFGDSDFSMRAKKAGYGLWVSNKAKVISDVGSSWISRWLEKPKLRYFYDLFFSRRSPYQFSTRHRFYKQHWPKGYRRALTKAYLISYLPVYASLGKGYIRSIKGSSKKS